jgi:hypothetical protein
MRLFIRTVLEVCLLGKTGLNEFEEINMIGVNLN